MGSSNPTPKSSWKSSWKLWVWIKTRTIWYIWPESKISMRNLSYGSGRMSVGKDISAITFRRNSNTYNKSMSIKILILSLNSSMQKPLSSKFRCFSSLASHWEDTKLSPSSSRNCGSFTIKSNRLFQQLSSRLIQFSLLTDSNQVKNKEKKSNKI